MAYDLFRGHSPKNFAIQGHPPGHSFEYVMSGGGYYAPPPRPWRSQSAPAGRSPSSTGASAPATPKPVAYEVSSTDWEATQRWMGNLAENIKAVRRELGNKILTADEVEKFADLWRRWLVLSSKVGSALTPMSPAVKREWEGLLGEGWQLYERFRLLGLNRVAPPYLGELAVILRTLPAEDSLIGMSSRLFDAARVSERLLDQGAVWWRWRQVPADPRPLAQSVRAARALAGQIAEVAKTAPGEGLRDQGAPIYAKVISVLRSLYEAASALYGSEEKLREQGQGEQSEDGGQRPRGMSVGWLIACGGLGYFGMKWLTSRKKSNVAGNDTPGYHPDVSHFNAEQPED